MKRVLGLVVLGVMTFVMLIASTGEVSATVSVDQEIQSRNSSATIEALQKQISSLLEMIKNLQSQLNNLRGGINPIVPEAGWDKIYGKLEIAGPSIQMWGTHQLTVTAGDAVRVVRVQAGNDEVLAVLKKYEGQNVTLWGQMKKVELEGGFPGFVAHKVYPEGYACILPAKVKIGYQGEDVRVVQQYLATDKAIYPEGLATGYYGNLTKKALEKFQAKNGIRVSGEFDDDTREKLEFEIERSERVRCMPRPIPIPPPIPNQGFKVYSPSTGENWQTGQTYKIAWSQVWPTIRYGCTEPQNGQPGVCIDPPPNTPGTTFAPVGPVRITLHGYIPCLYPEKPTDPICMIAEAAPYVIASSTDNDGVFEWAIPADLADQYRGKKIIRVEAVGGGMSGRSGVFTIGSSTNTNLPPVVSGVSGPTTLAVGATGTWTVKAYDPENKGLSYSVLWGDDSMNSGGAMVPKTMSVQNAATFTHVYNSAGTFNPVFYVTDEKGLQAKTSMSVVVQSM